MKEVKATFHPEIKKLLEQLAMASNDSVSETIYTIVMDWLLEHKHINKREYKKYSIPHRGKPSSTPPPSFNELQKLINMLHKPPKKT